MREIKFRAWDKIHNKMLQPSVLARLHFKNGQPYCFYTWDGGMYLNVELMQYTGLKDRNGKETYEDDYLSNNHGTWIIKWDDKYALYILKNVNPKAELKEICAHQIPNSEVIGNIYENSELLEVK